MDYGISERALAKWAGERLTLASDGPGTLRASFCYEGSTCTNGGTPFKALLHLALRDAGGGTWVVEDGWIEFPPGEQEAAAGMCLGPWGSGEPADRCRNHRTFLGRRLDEVVAESPPPVNPAGCFCGASMVHHKWRLALCTLHYALARGDRPRA